MCGSADVELKWKHFFVDADDPNIDCSLLVKNPRARRNLAARAISVLQFLLVNGFVATT